jgi:diguanylate cyclase (GGDEF)-like protein
VLEDITEQSEAMEVANKLIASISQPIMLMESTVSVTASVGIALSFNAGDNPKILVADADDALYQAKSAGKNTAICAQPQS